MKNILKSSLFLFAISFINFSHSQEVKKQEPVVKKNKFDASKNKPLKKEKVQVKYSAKKSVTVKK